MTSQSGLKEERIGLGHLSSRKKEEETILRPQYPVKMWRRPILGVVTVCTVT